MRSERLGELVKAMVREHRPVLVILGIGLVLRIMMMVALPAPLLNFSDANVYVRAAQDGLFIPEEGRTAGYPLFLRLLHDGFASPVVVVVVQHLLGLAAAAGLYWVATKRGVGRWTACIPAAAWACCLDWLWLEHQLLTEVVGASLVVAALLVVVTWPGRWWIVPVAAGLALAAGTVRPALWPCAPGIALAIVATAPAWRAQLARVTVFAATFGVLLLGYIGLQEDRTGFQGLVGGGLIDMGSYATAAPHADCLDFDVPPGTESLCQSVDSADRPGADYYYWNERSPGRVLLAARPDLQPQIADWGRRAIEADPGLMWRQRSWSARRLLGLGGFKRPVTDAGPDTFDFDQADVNRIPVAVEYVGRYYGADSVDYDSAGAPWGVLEVLQPMTRPPGLLLLAALLATLMGVVRGRDRIMAGAIGLTAWVPLGYVTWIGADYNWRYVLVSLPLVALAAVVAVSGRTNAREKRRVAGGW